MTLEPYLDDLESRIDPAVEAQLYEEWRRFADGKWRGSIFSPRRPVPAPPRIAWPEVTVNAAFEDLETMALQQLRQCSDALAAGGGHLLCMRANYSTAILPSLFGARLFMMAEETRTLPTSIPVEGGRDAIRALLDRGVPEPRAGLGARVLDAGALFKDILGRYPKLGRWVQLYHPDLQGPIDVCELIRGSELFYDLVDDPRLIEELLDLVTETYIAFLRAWHRIAPPRGRHSVHWCMLHEGHIMLRNDSSMNLSPEMYRHFVLPRDARLFATFGGGALHFCGRGDHYIADAAQIHDLHALAMSEPDRNDMELIFRHTVDREIRLLGFSRPAAEAALARGRNLRCNVHCW